MGSGRVKNVTTRDLRFLKAIRGSVRMTTKIVLQFQAIRDHPFVEFHQEMGCRERRHRRCGSARALRTMTGGRDAGGVRRFLHGSVKIIAARCE
jgi:hypothetical protein